MNMTDEDNGFDTGRPPLRDVRAAREMYLELLEHPFGSGYEGFKHQVFIVGPCVTDSAAQAPAKEDLRIAEQARAAIQFELGHAAPKVDGAGIARQLRKILAVMDVTPGRGPGMWEFKVKSAARDAIMDIEGQKGAERL